MSTAQYPRLSRRGGARWLDPVLYGLAIGLLAVAALYLGLLSVLRSAIDLANTTVGPVWIPMVAIGLRVGWLAARALRTRIVPGSFAAPVRPELSQLAPLFAALGLAGTVWGLSGSFQSLYFGEFLDLLPEVLAGLGIAMTSTLVGLALQITTLLVAAFNPAWSLVRVDRSEHGPVYSLDGTLMGVEAEGFGMLLEAMTARQPEAVCLEVDPRLGREGSEAVYRALWSHLDGSIPLRARGRA